MSMGGYRNDFLKQNKISINIFESWVIITYNIAKWLNVGYETSAHVTGRWLHSVEIRVGNSSVWSEMTTCGTYPGPSETGDIIVVECRPSRYGRYVTLKIVQLNYITDDSNAKNGNNALVFEEVVINGLYLWKKEEIFLQLLILQVSWI